MKYGGEAWFALGAALAALIFVGCLERHEPVSESRERSSRPVAEASPTHYPRRGFYGRLASNGAPILRDGGIASSAVDSAARFDVVVLDAPPMLLEPKIPAALKAANPSMTLLALVNTSLAWGNLRPPLGDSLTELNARRYRLARDMGGLLYGRNGRQWSANLDLSNHRFAIHLADLDAEVFADPNLDGIFCDWSCPSIAWAQLPGDSVDYRRAGWDTHRDWDRAYREGHRIYAERLREKSAGKLMVGNGGPSGERDVWNGWMRENFPYQNGGSWESNMIRTPWGDPGYLADESLYVAPRLSFLSTVIRPGDAGLSFGLASATLAGGVHVYVPSPSLREWMPDWFDLYDMDLGSPIGPAIQTARGWSREFSAGSVEVEPRTLWAWWGKK